ncbi:MAG TPA: hypothetical protein VGQ46_22955 [Thermoanaerobaculia bacterium]|nr:hypothetical protein [Thermoanaerobaculia bacterium]
MHAAGVALFLFAATMNAPLAQHAVLAPPPVVSPDPAPPHPLTPRDPEARFNTPAVSLARVIGALAQGVLRDHGH